MWKLTRTLGGLSKGATLCALLYVLLPLVAMTNTALPAAAAEGGVMLMQKVPGSPQAPEFALPDLDDQITKLSGLKGKVLVVNFWATWCPPCRKEMPSMERAWAKIKDKGVVLLAIHVGGNTDKIWDFTSQHNITFPVLIDKSGRTSRQWKTIGLPTTYVVDPTGRKVLRAIGGREWDNDKLLESILALRSDAKN